MPKRDPMGEAGRQPVSRREKDAASLSRLAAIVDNSPDAILVVDLGGTVTDWNHGAERLYGYSAEEMIGSSVSVVVPQEAAGELDTILETVRRGEVIGPYDTARPCKDGSLVYVSLTAAPITDLQGALTGISWIGRDVTERKRAVAGHGDDRDPPPALLLAQAARHLVAVHPRHAAAAR
jgi:PAS domain S-box-containing protein